MNNIDLGVFVFLSRYKPLVAFRPVNNGFDRISAHLACYCASQLAAKWSLRLIRIRRITLKKPCGRDRPPEQKNSEHIDKFSDFTQSGFQVDISPAGGQTSAHENPRRKTAYSSASLGRKIGRLHRIFFLFSRIT
ncbi:hypothetical protein [Citrobacter freundii]|uniref:hypothetical protein n=1 Tax=Citrobacter freundii TaxID=546 RepID=UPI002B394FAD|nr:hypothetical protein [Citrobacter freundii]